MPLLFFTVSRVDGAGHGVYCERWQFECGLTAITMSVRGGDITGSCILRPSIGAFFPFQRYFGSTIVLIPQECDRNPELSAFNFSARKFFENCALVQNCRVFRRNVPVERLYQEKYASFHGSQLPFLRLKLLEPLFYFQNGQSVLEENRINFLIGGLKKRCNATNRMV